MNSADQRRRRRRIALLLSAILIPTAAVILLVTPEGRVSRYLYGVRYEPRTLTLALTEASEGKIGTAWERFLLYCYHYDSRQGRYSLAAMKLMRAGGIATVLVLGAVLGSLWLKERRKPAEQA